MGRGQNTLKAQMIFGFVLFMIAIIAYLVAVLLGIEIE